MKKLYVVLFMGQGGAAFSWGMYGIRDQIRAMGVEADVYRYVDWAPAQAKIKEKRNKNYRIAGIGFSLGCSALSYLQRGIHFDLVICLAMSSLASNYTIVHKNTKRSILWHNGLDPLSSAGANLGFDKVYETALPHLLIPLSPTIRNNIYEEIKWQLQ